ncbi:hypothetical protein P9112_007726 [Eukaryota sp. TZLM1-RC]
MIYIDGRIGEGGGQVLRTSLSLASALGVPITIQNIRHNRKPKTGLRPQHLTCVNACAFICQASVEGNYVNSESLVFKPGTPHSGEFSFDIGTAGSCLLVLQTLIPPLLTCRGKSTVRVKGGTAVPHSPSFLYFSEVFLPMISRMGGHCTVECIRHGFFPKGGGEVLLEIHGLNSPHPLSPIHLAERGKLLRCSVLSAISDGIPEHVRRRQLETLHSFSLNHLQLPNGKIDTRSENWSTCSQGTLCFLRLDFENIIVGSFALGRRGKPAEEVAQEAIDQLEHYHHSDNGGVVDVHLADQLITLLAFTKGTSYFSTSELSLHCLTNAQVVNHFYPDCVVVSGEEGKSGHVRIEI